MPPVHPISKDIADLRSELVCRLLNISSTQDSTWKGLAVLADRIDNIAVNQEILLRKVSALEDLVRLLGPPPPNQGMSQRAPSPLPWMNLEDQEWYRSLMSSPERSISPDLTCGETMFPCKHQLVDPPSTVDGSTVNLEQGSPEEPMNYSQKLM